MGVRAGLNSKASCTFLDSNPYEYRASSLVAIQAETDGAHCQILLRMLRSVHLMLGSNTQYNF